MSRLVRLIGWTFFAGFLVAVGLGVFQFVRYRPRSSFTGLAQHLLLSADGSRLAALAWTEPNAGRGPLRVWDTRRGRVEHELFDGKTVQYFEPSPDGRHLAAALDDGVLRLVDWPAGRETRLDAERVQQFQFSPKGRWLFVGAAKEQDELAGTRLFRSVADRQMAFDVADQRLALRIDDCFLHSGNERFLFVRSWGERDIAVWDLIAGKKIAALPAGSVELAASPDETALAAWRHDQSGLEVWDTVTAKLRFKRDTDQAGALQASFSPDSKFLALWHRHLLDDSHLEILDAATGRLHWRFKMQHGVACNFLAHGGMICLLHGRDEKSAAGKTLTMLDVASGDVLWQRDGGFAMQFGGDAEFILYQTSRTAPLQFLEARTAACLATAPIDVDSWRVAPQLTRDGRHILLHGKQVRHREARLWETWLEKYWPNVFGDHLPCVSVLESATGREHFRLLHHGWQERMLSDDGSTLVTIDAAGENQENRFVTRVWDVSATRAWVWAVATALGMGLGLLAARGLWRRRATRKPLG